MNAESAQPRKNSNVTRPFPLQRVGSGVDETRSILAESCVLLCISDSGGGLGVGYVLPNYSYLLSHPDLIWC